jgi:hypothetical protein
VSRGEQQPAERRAVHRAVLSALSDGRWHGSAELADETRLLPPAVRAICRELVKGNLIRHGDARPNLGQWQIVTPGAPRSNDGTESGAAA